MCSDALDMDTCVELGRLHFLLKDYLAAATHFRAAAALALPLPLAPASTAAAAAAARAAARDSATAVEARHMLGVCLASTGDVGAAVEWYDRVLEVDPRHREALTNKAQAGGKDYLVLRAPT